jgi:CRP-like cAMP-binding protein
MFDGRQDLLRHLKITFGLLNTDMESNMESNFEYSNFHFISGSIFEGLSVEDKTFLRQNSVRKEITKGSIIFQQGIPPKGVYFLKKGKVKIYRLNSLGEEQIVYFYSSGEYFGFRPLICGTSLPVNARAIEDCVLSFVPREIFMDLLQRSQAMTNALLQKVCAEHAVWVNTMTAFSAKPVKERLALSLLILNEKYRRKDSEHAPVINVTRADYANYIGTSVESMVRILSKLKQEDIIGTKGRKVTIKRYEDLVRIANL